MSLEQVKLFMRKKFPRELVESKKLANERPVYYRSNHVIDLPKKMSTTSNMGALSDESGLHLTNDPRSHPFKLIDDFLGKNSGGKLNDEQNDGDDDADAEFSDTVISLIKKPRGKTRYGSDENLDIIRRNYGNELYEFMMDKRSGKLNKKYHKVFIC